jgi:hypothetical protein
MAQTRTSRPAGTAHTHQVRRASCAHLRQPLAEILDQGGCNALAEQIASAPCRRQSGVGRDGVDRSWWLVTAGRIESIREHEQGLEVLREVYAELLACFPKHAQPIRFVDLRIGQRK